MLVGALDPLEGAVVILAGSGLVALGTFFGRAERESFPYWILNFILIPVGVGAMFVLSAFGGIGGNSGHSMWWGVFKMHRTSAAVAVGPHISRVCVKGVGQPLMKHPALDRITGVIERLHAGYRAEPLVVRESPDHLLIARDLYEMGGLSELPVADPI